MLKINSALGDSIGRALLEIIENLEAIILSSFMGLLSLLSIG